MSTPNSVFSLPNSEAQIVESVIPVNQEQAYFDTQFTQMASTMPELIEQAKVDIEFSEIIQDLYELEAIGRAIIEARHREAELLASHKSTRSLGFVLKILKDLM